MFLGRRGNSRKIKGVRSTAVGYAGGWFPNPNYDIVCNDKTGHAEAVQVQFDPNEVSYEQLLKVFWSIHNPTTKGSQGLDYGKQYRSAIFFHTPQQESIARTLKDELSKSGRFKAMIVTEIQPASKFFHGGRVSPKILHEALWRGRDGKGRARNRNELRLLLS